MDSQRHIYSVSELNTLARETLEDSFGLIWLEAELSNLARPGSGHWYFSLKDKQAQIRCAFFKNRNRLLDFTPEDGARVLVRGRISLYEARGDYQLIVDHMEPAGEGDLQRAFEQLKTKLQGKGYFDETNKQLLPTYPRCIGVITSPTGAVIRDIQNVHSRRFPAIPLIVYPAKVQGEGAAKQLISMIKTAIARQECDVLILARGGGSLEDLWAFNDERLAETIFDCPIPIVTGIGHEVDFTIADFVSDVRAPTPSAAIELITPDQDELSTYLYGLSQQLAETMLSTVRAYAQQLDWHEQKLLHFHPEKQLHRHQERLAAFENRMQLQVQAILNNQQAIMGQINKRLVAQSPESHIIQSREHVKSLLNQLKNKTNQYFHRQKQALSDKAHAMDTLSPLSTLSRGYSITSKLKHDKAIRHIKEVVSNELIETRLIDGLILSRVESTREKDT